MEILEFEDYTSGTLEDYCIEEEKKANKEKLPDYITDRAGILSLLKTVYKTALVEDPMYAEEILIDERNVQEGIYAVNPDNITLFKRISEDEQREYNEKDVPNMWGKVSSDS